MYDNIALARPAATAHEVAEAAAQAGLSEVIGRHGAGLGAVLGEGGIGLAGGEAQRVALARAFLAPTPVLLLDEPTAHLDRETERHLVPTLLALAEGRTTLIATHSPALLAACTTVVELDRGRLRLPPSAISSQVAE